MFKLKNCIILFSLSFTGIIIVYWYYWGKLYILLEHFNRGTEYLIKICVISYIFAQYTLQYYGYPFTSVQVMI